MPCKHEFPITGGSYACDKISIGYDSGHPYKHDTYWSCYEETDEVKR